MAKPRLLERMGLVERVPEDTEYETSEVVDKTYETEETAVSAESVDEVVKDTLISDIYAKNHITDLSSSIFKVEDVSKSLPMEMATDTKRSAVLGILSSFNLTATDVTADGENRVDVLESVQSQIQMENSAAIGDRKNRIEDLKSQIEVLNKEISDLESETETADDTINAEVKRIKDLINFIIGGKKA